MAAQERLSLWTDISRGMVIVNLLLTVVVVGTQAAALKYFGIDELLQLAHIFWRTAPLSLALATITFVTLRQMEHDDLNFLFTVLLTAGSLFLATCAANVLGDLRVEKAYEQPVVESYSFGTAIDYSVRMLYSYYLAYGARDFWSSVIVGGFLGWTWGRVASRFSRTQATAATPAVKMEADEPQAKPLAKPKSRRRKAA